jgi:hypothetical protein
MNIPDRQEILLSLQLFFGYQTQGTKTRTGGSLSGCCDIVAMAKIPANVSLIVRT